ncbi:MAG: sugar ABC transporter permease [Caldilineaceae bacterium]|nr:sugar ABC transporter permease [Caldilineaceae bacterium]
MAVSSAPSAGQPAYRPANSRYYNWEKVAPYVFISPFFILFGIFGAFPLLFAVWISLQEWKSVRANEYVGFENYARLFTDSNFHIALSNTAILGILVVPLMVIFSLSLANVLNQPIRGRVIYRTAYFLPVVTSLVVVGLLFDFLLGSPYSPLGSLLEIFDIEFKGLLDQPVFIKPSILVMILWRWVGYNMMIMLAGLQSIPHELYEAARIDGASGLQAFIHITVPLMRRVIAFAAILSTIGMFNIFEEAYMLVGPSGGTDRAGLLMGLIIYSQAFRSFNFGYASALAYANAVIIIALSFLQIVASERAASD